ncbi:protein FRA10AC1 isoform X2 [Carettochelys insculpta]|uniref:protein FRA10AC1 isoform X2 n=1 Tax=Carettochelys insculpta TaxID=44489 RepID=UPI003EBB1D0A
MVPAQLLRSQAVHGRGGYDSDFSDDESGEKSDQRNKRTINEDALLVKPFHKVKQVKVAHRQIAAEEWDREEARNRRFHLIAMDAYARHTKFVNDYILYYGGKKEDFKRSGEKRLAKKYYDKLFKEYCIADLSRYKENKFGFRWRHEKEVVSGKGQFSCGNKHCDEKEGLKSWEVNFGYIEYGEKRNALVKLRLCPECSRKLNFHHRRREVKPKKKKERTEDNSEEPQSTKLRLSHPEKHRSKRNKQKDQVSSEVSGDFDDDPNESEEQDVPSDADFWKGPLQETDEKSREEEFDEYFQDLFL